MSRLRNIMYVQIHELLPRKPRTNQVCLILCGCVLELCFYTCAILFAFSSVVDREVLRQVAGRVGSLFYNFQEQEPPPKSKDATQERASALAKGCALPPTSPFSALR